MNSKAKDELLSLMKSKKGGVLKPEEVVEFARYSETALHSVFDWDDSVAGAKWRIEQARNYMRVVVVYEPTIERNVKPLWSLPPDRKKGGYRSLDKILSSKHQRKIMVEMAVKELTGWCDRFADIPDLKELVASVRAIAAPLVVVNETEPKPRRRKATAAA